MKLEVEVAGKTRVVEYAGRPDATIDGKRVSVDARLMTPGVLSLVVAGRAWRAVLDDDASGPAILIGNARVPYQIHDPRSLQSRRAHRSGAAGPIAIRAPMPGRVIRVLVGKGETVESGQGVVVIEAMKMQNELKSPKSGSVVELRAAPGDTVSSGDTLAVIA